MTLGSHTGIPIKAKGTKAVPEPQNIPFRQANPTAFDAFAYKKQHNRKNIVLILGKCGIHLAKICRLT